MTELTGKVAIVTGASRDIGRAVAIELGRCGARVVVNHRDNEAAAQTVVAEITEAGGLARAVRADVTKGADIARMIADTRTAFGEEVHILVNVAGGMVERRPLEAMDERFFNHVMQLNVTSTFLVTQAVVPLMPAGSAIVNFASQAGRDGGGPGACAYATSKGAVMTFTRAMAKELGPRGIRVNALCPGMIATTFHDTFTKPEVRQSVAAATPLRRQGEAEEIGATVAWLASDAAAFITGANIDINGGMLFS
ncbi:SDR family NAD(P)-dependent oxidoreductase [Novosphingobium sp.]|uniref:SDR family NAD(P)-dependent oxidoreductase n=1 Tax=Novosphingobium sp. TaxID=1874826 RepID=UPI0026034818|nr:3-oxoacyl-ACP reductase family protein [Novosphingobium sp.]